ncbi:protein FAM90A27P-like [Herpailurus yagouaroundi]|uniref:protein FAM90A27P-like n=1 Tax=Herpailurus yagouaroundi TaxID=1608482 RepID=UPI001AD7DC42|nr:protein FAM90A27P-like [Puma yagouaroundi]
MDPNRLSMEQGKEFLKQLGIPQRDIDSMTEKWVVDAAVEVLLRFPLMPGEDPGARCVSSKKCQPSVDRLTASQRRKDQEERKSNNQAPRKNDQGPKDMRQMARHYIHQRPIRLPMTQNVKQLQKGPVGQRNPPPEEENTRVKCKNCGAFGHLASSRRCPMKCWGGALAPQPLGSSENENLEPRRPQDCHTPGSFHTTDSGKEPGQRVFHAEATAGKGTLPGSGGCAEVPEGAALAKSTGASGPPSPLNQADDWAPGSSWFPVSGGDRGRGHPTVPVACSAGKKGGKRKTCPRNYPGDPSGSRRAPAGNPRTRAPTCGAPPGRCPSKPIRSHLSWALSPRVSHLLGQLTCGRPALLGPSIKPLKCVLVNQPEDAGRTCPAQIKRAPAGTRLSFPSPQPAGLRFPPVMFPRRPGRHWPRVLCVTLAQAKHPPVDSKPRPQPATGTHGQSSKVSIQAQGKRSPQVPTQPSQNPPKKAKCNFF